MTCSGINYVKTSESPWKPVGGPQSHNKVCAHITSGLLWNSGTQPVNFICFKVPMLLFKSSVILQQLISDHFTFFMDHNSKDLGLKQLSQLAILLLINLVFRICERKKKSESENQYFLHSFKSFVC